MKLKLIPEWKDCWRWSSVRCMALVGAVSTSWLAVPDDLRAAAPPWFMAAIALGLTLLGAVARVTVFELKHKPPVPVKKPTKKRKR